MSKKIAVISDSTGCLTEEMLKEHNIYTSYLMIIFGNDSYQEFKEITPAKFVELSALQAELPTTSQPSPGLTVEIYENIFKEGYDEIIHVTISSGLSGSYQSALNAATMVDADKIHVFDSKTVAFPQGALAIAAAKLAKAGNDATTIVSELKKIQETTHISATVKTLENLKKGGRLSNASAVIGSMLQIKPIVAMSDEGKLEAVGKVRTFKKAIQSLIDTAKDANLTDSYEIGIMHMENLEDATTLKNAIAELYPNITFHVLPLSLVVSAHVGEGTVGVTWIKAS
jgi:DegV family protein with EDD domain